MVEKCLWKKQIEKSKSTGGKDLRKNPTLLCGKCSGTDAGAKEINCDKFLTKGVLTPATTEKPRSLSNNSNSSETAKA